MSMYGKGFSLVRVQKSENVNLLYECGIYIVQTIVTFWVHDGPLLRQF